MLALFDIDGTLLQNASADHLDAIVGALEETFGLDREAGVVAPSVAVAGRTDIEIARELAFGYGVSPASFQAARSEFEVACVECYDTVVPADLSKHVVAGISQLLDLLTGDPRVDLSLVTGNLEGIARIKLARAGLGHFFADGQGGFGSDHEDRRRLPPIARARAGEIGDEQPREGKSTDQRFREGRLADERSYPRAQTVLIGDTPLDIACARADQIRCIAVTSGSYGARELRQADAVAPDARTLGELLSGILDGVSVGAGLADLGDHDLSL